MHPQSTVHAMVEYNDGSVIAQVSATDMRMPIQYALTWPDRAEAPVPRLDWTYARQWEFHPPDLAKFPLLGLAYEAQSAGGSATCTLNAADEIAVEAFLTAKIRFPGSRLWSRTRCPQSEPGRHRFGAGRTAVDERVEGGRPEYSSRSDPLTNEPTH